MSNFQRRQEDVQESFCGVGWGTQERFALTQSNGGLEQLPRIIRLNFPIHFKLKSTLALFHL